MTEDDFCGFVDQSVKRATDRIGRVGHLLCTQSANPRERKLREPEMRIAFQQEAEARNLFYGIEVPTTYPYRISGEGERCALIDFALLEDALDTDGRIVRNVLMELKEGQPYKVRADESSAFDCPTITKDMHRLWAEPARFGRCIFHICQAADSGTPRGVAQKVR